MTDDHIQIERELRAALAEKAARLPSPRVDLRAVRRRSAVRRRVLVPALAAALGLAVAAPFAIAKSGVLATGSGRASVDDGIASTLTTAGQLPGAGSGVGVPLTTPKLPQSGAGAKSSGGGEKAVPGAGTAPVTDCVRRSGPLPAAERSKLLDDGKATVAGARRTLRGELDEVEDLEVSGDDLSRLLPRTGDPVTLVDCAGKQRLADGYRKALLDQVRAALLSSGAVADAVLDQSSGWLRPGAGDATLEVTAVHRTGKEIAVQVGAYSGLPPALAVITVTVRLSDYAVVEADLSALVLGDLGLDGLDEGEMRERLRDLSGRLPGVAPGILAPGATVVPPSGR